MWCLSLFLQSIDFQGMLLWKKHGQTKRGLWKTFAGIVMEYDLHNGVKSFLKERCHRIKNPKDLKNVDGLLWRSGKKLWTFEFLGPIFHKWHDSDAGRWKTLKVPVVIGDDNLPSPVGNRVNWSAKYWGGQWPPWPPQFRHHWSCWCEKATCQKPFG